MNNKQERILAVSSQGGHWIQLQRMQPAFANYQIHYVCTDPAREVDVHGNACFHNVVEASRWNKFLLLYQAFQILWLLIKVRPSAVISTGAASGYFAVRFAKMMGIRTIWVDSMANVDELSLSGRKALKYADAFYTQWENLAVGSILYRGNVLGAEHKATPELIPSSYEELTAPCPT
ncbi:MAG: hypothetical protein HQL32_07350 [Planctomycetes bacterium]|nr:hypothetical protein [Planctomycetota bacterium]